MGGEPIGIIVDKEHYYHQECDVGTRENTHARLGCKQSTQQSTAQSIVSKVTPNAASQCRFKPTRKQGYTPPLGWDENLRCTRSGYCTSCLCQSIYALRSRDTVHTVLLHVVPCPRHVSFPECLHCFKRETVGVRYCYCCG
jgi:hypothetical protein